MTAENIVPKESESAVKDSSAEVLNLQSPEDEIILAMAKRRLASDFRKPRPDE